MIKKVLMTGIMIISLFGISFAQYGEELDIVKQQYSDIAKGIGYNQKVLHFADDSCNITIEVKSIGDEIRMIELRRMEDTRSYTYQYYYWDDELFFVYTHNDINEGENDNGVIVFRSYEYRHYFSGMQCIKSLYKGYRYTEKVPKVKNIEFYDYGKAYDERERAYQLLEYVKKDDWRSICTKMVFPI